MQSRVHTSMHAVMHKYLCELHAYTNNVKCINFIHVSIHAMDAHIHETCNMSIYLLTHTERRTCSLAYTYTRTDSHRTAIGCAER